jgi:hypothetical protein
MESIVNVEYVIRTQSNFANTFGLGEVISPGVTLFRAGTYDLTREEAETLLASKRKQVVK